MIFFHIEQGHLPKILYFCAKYIESMEKNKKLLMAIAALLLIVVALGVLTVTQYQKNSEMTQLYAVEKEEMENEYSTFATHNDEQQVQTNNNSQHKHIKS